MYLSLRFLGSFEAQIDGSAVSESRAKKIEALLAFLATESDRAHRRERLVGLLFPEMPDDQARTNLRQTLTRLRRAISDKESDPPYLLVTRESTQFNLASAHFLDVVSFEEALSGCQAHRLEREQNCQDCIHKLSGAVELYRGPFLEGFSLDDSSAYEEWILNRREQYHSAALTALQQLADYHEWRGSYAVAAGFVRHQLRLEPWKEEAHRQLMRLLAYQGQRSAALQQYLMLKRMLEDELGVEPLAETRALNDSIRTVEDNRPYRLPPRKDIFVGREKELAVLNEYLTDPDKRMVTLTGPGGSGKTATATETGWRVARRFLGPFFHGVFFVPLAGIHNREGIETLADSVEFDSFVTAVAEAVGFSFSGPRRPREQLSRYLQDKSLLLIIDNIEHVINETRPLLIDLLQRAPGIKLLITSRERLGLNEEWVVDIEGLPYPGSGHAGDAAAGQQLDPTAVPAQYQAVALFEHFGKRLVPGFSLSDERDAINGDCPVIVVQGIVQLVQGLPLGIELAASWLRTLNCREIAAEIENSLDFLSSTMHGLPSRHQSLRAVFDSSWQLLDGEEQQTLRRLSVFNGPFDRKAATAVSEASLATLSALVDHSMLHRQDQDISDQHVGNYEVLDVLRQYAMEQLEDHAEEAEKTRERHATFYLQFLNQQQKVVKSSNQQQALTAISQNIRELRSAWRWAVQHQDISGLADALDTLALFCYMRSWFAEGAELFGFATGTLAAEREKTQVNVVWAKLRARQGWFTFLLGKQKEGLDQLLESIEVLRIDGDPVDLAYSLSFSAAALTVLGDYEAAKRTADEALAINEKLQDAYGCAISNNILSQLAYQQADYRAAKRHSEVSLQLERAIGNRWSIGFSLANLGRVSFALRNYEEAYNNFQESLAIRQSLKDTRGQALCLRYLGETARARGDMDLAKQDLEAGLDLFRGIGSQDETSATLNSLGYLALDQGERKSAQRYFVEALQVARQAATTPRVLDAIVSLAGLLVEDNPLESARIAVIIRDHPAANRKSRKQAGSLLEEIGKAHARELADINLNVESSTNMNTLIDNLLAAFA